MSNHVSQYNDDVSAERCYFCPTTHDLQTHHLVPQRKNGSNRKENLVIVCERCHKKLENLYNKRFYERLGLSDDKGEERTHFACRKGDCRNGAVVAIKIRQDVGWYCWDCSVPILARSDDPRESVERLIDDIDEERFWLDVRGRDFSDYREEMLNNSLTSVKGWEA